MNLAAAPATPAPNPAAKGKTPKGTVHTPTNRRTLSGTLVGKHEPGYPTWHELVQKPAKVEPRVRTGAFYDAMAELPKPEDLVEVLVKTTPSWRHRRGQHAGYTRALRRQLGLAWSAKLAARRMQRVLERNRQFEARAARAAAK